MDKDIEGKRQNDWLPASGSPKVFLGGWSMELLHNIPCSEAGRGLDRKKGRTVPPEVNPTFQTGKQLVQEGGGMPSRKGGKIIRFFFVFVLLRQMCCRTFFKYILILHMCLHCLHKEISQGLLLLL